MSTCLISGITGQDGAYLAQLLLSKGSRVVGLVRHSATLDFVCQSASNFDPASSEDVTRIASLLLMIRYQPSIASTTSEPSRVTSGRHSVQPEATSTIVNV